MANLLSNTTIGGYQSIHTGNVGSYALTSLPSHNHDDRYFTETESDGRFQPLENQRLSTGNSPTFADLYSNGWFRNYNNYGLYNQTHGNHFYATSNNTWNIAANGSYPQIVFRSGGYDGTIRGFVYADTSNQIGFLNNAGDWSLRTNSSKDTQIFGTLTVGSGTSADIYMTDTDETTRRIHTNSGRIGFLNSSSNWGAYCDNTGNWFSDHSMRAPIFYDSNDTAYYLDPNGTSHVVNIEAVGFVGFNGNQTRDKLRVWDSGTYTIGMKNGYDYGHLGTDEYAMSFQMNNNSGRGFWWGDEAHNDNQGAASLTTDGRMVIAKSLSIGEGEAVVSPSSVPLYVTGTTAGSDVFAVDGVNGRLFTVTDDLTDSLFSVNTIAGLPVIEAFADNTVKIGKYGSNSITISDSKIAINSDLVDSNFPFYVGDRSVAGSRYSLTNKGMGFNLADNYAQLQLYGGNGSYIDFVTASGQDSAGRIMWDGNFNISGTTYFANNIYTYTLYDRNDTGYYLDMNGTSRLGTLNINQLSVYGNTYLGDGNGDEVHINDILRVGATDSGDAHFYFGEGGSAGSDYGSHWYWDSGYTFTWYTRNAGSDTALFDYVTNDTTYINWRRNFHMQNREINYTAQLHFNGGTRFVTYNSNYLYFQPDSTSVGGILVRDGNSSIRGYSAYFDSSGFGLLNSTGNWGIRLNPGNVETELFYAGTWRVRTGSAGIGVNGNVYIDQDYGFGIVGVYSADRYQGIFAMGDAYKLAANGQSTGNLYGLAWTHTNVGGQSKAGLEHQLLVMNYGTTLTAIGNGIWTAGTITTVNHGNSSQWNSAYSWGNHASAGYITSSGSISGTAGSISGFNNPTTASTANTIVYRDASGDVAAREFVLTSSTVHTVTPSSIVGIYPTTNQVVKFSASAIQTFLGLGSLAYSSATIPTNNNQLTNGAGYITGISFANVSSKPTTISGYGITDALYQNRDTINVDAFNATGLYRGSTSGWSNRPSIIHNGGALLTIDTHPGEYHSQFFFDTGGDRLYFRNANGGSWGSWLTMFHTGNYTSYVPTLTGTGASGTWSINVTGSAGSASTAGSATNLYGTGGSSIQSTSTGTSYTANYQVRENAGGSGNTNEIYAPQLAFHWGGVVASSIMMESSGRMAIRNNPGGSYENFIAAVIYSSGYGDSTQWNTAYSWGNHASAGYVTSSALSSYLPLSGGTMSGHLNVSYNIASPSNYYSGLQAEIMATSGTAGIALHRSGYSHVGIYHDSINELKFNFNGGTPILPATAGTLWGSGNLTNLNQLSNGPGYITGYTETDTLATVTARGATTASGITFTAPGGSVLLKHAVSESDAWIFQENAANWGLYYKNAPSGNHTFGGYTTVGAETFGMSAANVSGNGVLTSNFVGATTAYAQWMLSNYTGYIWSASTIYAVGAMRAYEFRGNANVAGTGEASYHPAGVYSTGTNWLYGTMYVNGNSINDAGYLGTIGTNTTPINITGASHKYLTINPGNGYEAMVRYIGGSGSSWYVGKRTSGQLVGTQSFHFYSEEAGATVGGITPGGIIYVTDKFESTKASGTIISHGAMTDAFGWNGSYGTYIGSTVGGTYYIYGNGTFYDNGSIRTFIHSGNIGSQSVSYASSAGNADTVDGYHATNAASGLAYYASNGYLYVPSWINVGSAGIFSSTNNAHIRPNTATYGAWEMIGSKGGWSGIFFNDSGDYLMANNNEVGHYQNGVGWKFRWYQGEMYISSGTTGGGTERTVIHSGNIGSQSVSYATTAGTANAVAWTNVSSRPTALSQFTNDLGNYGGFLTSITAHSHAISDVSGLQTALDGKQAAGSYAASSHTHDDRYYTESESDTRFARRDADSAISGNLVIGNGTYGNSTAYGSSGARLMFSGSDTDAQNNYYIGTNHNDYGGNYSKLELRWHTGIRMGAQPGYGGIRFYDTEDLGTVIFSVGTGDSHVRVVNNLYVGGNLALHAGNYNSYSPTLTGGNASGTWGINVTGSAGSVAWTNVSSRPTALSQFSNDLGNYGGWLTTGGKAADSELFDGTDSIYFVKGNGSNTLGRTTTNNSGGNSAGGLSSGFYDGSGMSNMPTSDWYHLIVNSHHNSATSNQYEFQLATAFWDKSNFYVRSISPGDVGPWRTLIHNGNIGSQSVSYASTAGSATSATTATTATVASQLNKFGDIYGQDWNSYYVQDKLIAAAVYGHSGSNRPNLTYDYGVALSYGEATGPLLQMYFPENSGNIGTIFRKGTYRTGWNGNWSTWKTLVEQEGNLCTIVGGNGTGLEVHGNVGYNQDPLTYFLIRGQADTSWKALKIRLTGDAGGQDIEFRRIAENGTDSRMWYVPRGANTVNFDYPIVQPSDSRLKDNITPISTPVDKIKSLRGVEFDWNSGEQVGTHDVGLIAQDVEAVLPEAVTTQEDGYKNLAYTKVIPLLVEAMKEQQAMIEALRAEVELLKNK